MLRIIRYKRELRSYNILRTKRQLIFLKKVILRGLKKMNFNINRLRNLEIRFGQNGELNDCDACIHFYILEIVIARNAYSIREALDMILHEIGHEATVFGRFRIIKKQKTSFLCEISAYNFAYRFCRFYKLKHTKTNFLAFLRYAPLYCIADTLKFIPLGSLIKNEYKLFS